MPVVVFLCIISILVFAYVCVYEQNWSNVINYITLGVTIPLVLYLLDWSSLIETKKSPYFIYIFIVFYILLLVYTFITHKIRPKELFAGDKVVITKNGKILIPTINVTFFVFYFIENYLGSGSFYPALLGYDIHTFSAPIISYVTATPFLVVATDYFAYKATKKKKYLFLILLACAVPVITRGSRMAIVSMSIGFIVMLQFFEKNLALANLEKLKKYNRYKLILVVAVIVVGLYLVYFTTVRMNHYGKYSMKYDEVIKYTGPEWFKFLAAYYGYFPLSFNNLNVNLLLRKVSHNYIGLYSFYGLFFGLLQFDTFLGIDGQGDIAGRYITSVSATVPTGFWDFYYDYGVLLFIPMIVAFLICAYFLNRASKEVHTLNHRAVYFWFVSLWFLMSFQNTIFGSTVIVCGIILNFIIKYSFYVYTQDQ